MSKHIPGTTNWVTKQVELYEGCIHADEACTEDAAVYRRPTVTLDPTSTLEPVTFTT
jgi:hypothetical protein